MSTEGIDKEWMRLNCYHSDFHKGVLQFLEFVKKNSQSVRGRYRCPCTRCCNIVYKEDTFIYKDVTRYGILQNYVIWHLHGEIASNFANGDEQMFASSSYTINPMEQFVDDLFPFREANYGNQSAAHEEHSARVPIIDPIAAVAMQNYENLMQETKTPLFEGSPDTALGTLLEAITIKDGSGFNDSQFTVMAEFQKRKLPQPNKYPASYEEAKKTLKSVGMDFEVLDACVNGCFLYYKEDEVYDQCPECGEPRYSKKKKRARKTVRYFPLTPRLQRLFMSSDTADKMRWHGQREKSADDDVLRHPADGEAWKDFDRSFPDFARDCRNVRLALATDGFSPYGSSARPYSCWPINLIPYNLPPSMCMKKEFNILSMLISGPKSPGKCLNVFMRPLIDELKVLWNTGVLTYDRVATNSFMMRAAVMWTISDFPGLGMLGGIQTKGYKSCPICLDEIDATFSHSRMSYTGSRRWLDDDHPFRFQGELFNGKTETRKAPKRRDSSQVYEMTRSHIYPKLSLKEDKIHRPVSKSKLCWTHVSIFWELPYWKKSQVRHALDVMHIEKNVCDNVVGTILGFTGKTKDDVKARKTLEKMGIRKKLWVKTSSTGKTCLPRASYNVKPEHRMEVLDHIAAVRYPSGYAGSLKNKVNITDKKFYGLKTHDCHVLLQRILPVVIRPYVGTHVADVICELSRFFQMICAREVRKSDVEKMQKDIVLILCKLETIFPPSFFTIMVHLCIHLPEQVLLTGPVHYTWMFPIERQLGEYKRTVTNKCYPEGCISKRYIVHECVRFINLYMCSGADESMKESPKWNISVFSEHITNLTGGIRHNCLSAEELKTAHWLVLDNCTEVRPWITAHETMYACHYPNGNLEHRIESFNLTFGSHVNDRKNKLSKELKNLALGPKWSISYLKCQVNGVRWVSIERDRKRITQNSGVIQVVDDVTYYGVLLVVFELLYGDNMPVVLFKCKWFDEKSVKNDRGLISVNTNTDCYRDNPFILALQAQQVFYIDDPKLGHPWKVVNHMFHRGVYNEKTLARDKNVGPLFDVEEPYQEPITTNIPICEIFIDMGNIPFIDIPSDEDEDGEDYEEVEDDGGDGDDNELIDDDDSDVESLNNDPYLSSDEENNANVDDDNEDDDSDDPNI